MVAVQVMGCPVFAEVGDGEQFAVIGIRLKVAIHALFAFIVTCPLALQSPLHPAKLEIAFGVAVAVTGVHAVYVPAPVVVPPPVPAVVMVRV